MKAPISVLLLLTPFHVALAATEKAPDLTLAGFLSQVRGKHQGIQASDLASEGAHLRSSEGSLVFSPGIFANAQFVSDARETTSPPAQGEKTVYNTYNLGVSQVTPFGLSARLFYSLGFTNITGANPSFLPNPRFHVASPTLELTQSLLRNWGGREVRATAEAMDAAAKATEHAESYKTAVALAEAETAYWRLSLARQAVSLQRDSYDRALRIKEWTERRVKLHLTEDSDFLQSEAVVGLRQLELQQAVDEEAAAARLFNSLRAVDSLEVTETLELLSGDRVRALAAPERSGDRFDVLAAREQSRAAAAQSRAALERNRAVLELFGSASLNGRAVDSSGALSSSFDTDHPMGAIGVRFQGALDFGRRSDVRAGYARDVAAAERMLDRKLFEQERDWVDAQVNFAAAQRRYALAEKIETLQKDKYQAERGRHSRGRTTTFQVLQFEQDYFLSQLGRLRSASEILQIHSRMNLFSAIPMSATAQTPANNP